KSNLLLLLVVTACGGGGSILGIGGSGEGDEAPAAPGGGGAAAPRGGGGAGAEGRRPRGGGGADGPAAEREQRGETAPPPGSVERGCARLASHPFDDAALREPHVRHRHHPGVGLRPGRMHRVPDADRARAPRRG